MKKSGPTCADLLYATYLLSAYDLISARTRRLIVKRIAENLVSRMKPLKISREERNIRRRYAVRRKEYAKERQ